MFKPMIVNAAQFEEEQPVIAESDVKNVFKVLHGYYGNLFFTKFATGVMDKGEDQGLANARRIWAHGLRAYDAETIKTALRNCQARHSEYPPSLPQFAALCAAAKPRAVFQIGAGAIGMSQELRSSYARNARKINERHAERTRERLTGDTPLPGGLEGLKRAIANAVGAGGGDEARELLRLDRMFAGDTKSIEGASS